MSIVIECEHEGKVPVQNYSNWSKLCATRSQVSSSTSTDRRADSSAEFTKLMSVDEIFARFWCCSLGSSKLSLNMLLGNKSSAEWPREHGHHLLFFKPFRESRQLPRRTDEQEHLGLSGKIVELHQANMFEDLEAFPETSQVNSINEP